jgi:flagellar basal-body rod modification protein FlgD
MTRVFPVYVHGRTIDDMEVTSAAGSNNATIVDPNDTGFAGLTSESFMKLLITQLQNQDPTEPVGNDELLSQLSAMRNLESNIELGDSLKAITSNQQLSTAASFIGKAVTGKTATGEEINGLVERAFLRDEGAFLGVNDQEIPMQNVISVDINAE